MNNPRMGVRHLAALLLVMLTGRSLAAELLKDINTVPVPASSNPRYLGAAGSTVLFVAGSGIASAELGLWATDGTVAGTRKLLSNDTSSAFFNPQSLLTLGSRVLWSGPGPGGGIDLWASDGSAAGTLKIGQLEGNPLGVLGVIPGGVAVFAASDAAGKTEIWRTDGTPAGTWRVAVFDSVELDNRSAAVGGLVYFTATTSATGSELWVTDGSNVPGNTHLVADLEAGPGSSDPFQLTAVGNRLFFTAILGNSGIPQLWTRDGAGNVSQLTSEPLGAAILCSADNFVLYHSIGQPGRSDGTPAGTFRLRSGADPDFQSIGPCLAAGSRVFFSATINGLTTRLWQSDGTVNGTSELPIATSLQAPTPLLWTGSHLFFGASEAVNGSELWVTDGTGTGTHIVMDAFPGPAPASGSTSVIAASGSQVFIIQTRFSYNFPDDLLSQVWRADLDGTNAVRLTNNISVEPYGAAFPYSLVAQGHIFFTSRKENQGIEPSASDGTPAGTSLLRDIAPQTQNLASLPIQFAPLGTSTTIFSADDGLNGRELWRTDGTAIGTTLLADIFPGARGSEPSLLGAIDGKLYFFADDGVHGRELWFTDNSVAGTRLIADIEPGTGNSDPGCLSMLKLGNFNIFSAYTGAAGTELWRTDGAGSGAQLFVDVLPGTESSNACPLAVVGSSLYFTAQDARGREVWVTDGTAAGTHIVADVVPGVLGSNPRSAVAFQGELLFAAAPSLTPPPFGMPRQLWRTGAGGNSPSLVWNAAPGGIAWVQTSGAVLYFAVTGGAAPGVYRWNGGSSTPERFLTDIVGAAAFAPVQFGTRVAFVGTSAAEGTEVFATDGTLAGTSALTNLSAAGESNVMGPLTVLGQNIYFGFASLDGTRQLARTDGTPAGTQVLTQFAGPNGGPNGGVIDGPALAGGQVVFSATDGTSEIGYELYVQRNQLPSATNDAASVTAGQSVSINLAANDTDADGRVIAATARVTAGPSRGTVTIDSSGVATYTANTGFSGTDAFSYAVSDDNGAESAAATVTVTVNAPAASPPPSPPGNGSSGGGGGVLELLTLLSLGGLVIIRARRPLVRHADFCLRL